MRQCGLKFYRRHHNVPLPHQIIAMGPQQYCIDSSPRWPRFVLVPIRFASEAWPRAGFGEPRSASNANKPASSWPSKQDPKKLSKHGGDKETSTEGELSSKEAERIRGRMLFFECFVHGRVASLDLKLFEDLCKLGRTSPVLLPDDEIKGVQRLCLRLETGKAILLGIRNLDTWLIFTDCACEGDTPTGSVGGRRSLSGSQPPCGAPLW